MPFCSGCGNDLAATARFCPRCGTPLAAGAAPAPDSASFAQAPEPLDYTIQGDNLQVALDGVIQRLREASWANKGDWDRAAPAAIAAARRDGRLRPDQFSAA